MRALLIIAALTVLDGSAQTPQSPQSVAVFEVSKSESTLLVGPIVILTFREHTRPTGPEFSPPIPHTTGITPSADFNEFEQAYYKPGTQLNVYFGGEARGLATIRNSNILGREGGCRALTAEVSSEIAAPGMIATTLSSEVGGHKSTRRPATVAEKAVLRKLAIEWLGDYGLDKNLLVHGKLGMVTSTELRKGKRAIIGLFDVRAKRATHRLFVIAEIREATYKTTLAELRIQQEPEMGGQDRQEIEFIDQLDLDGDYEDEVITVEHRYESWNYTIWKFNGYNKAWQSIYTGGGGGC